MQIIHGDCLEVMRGLAANSVDSIITDPPYGLSHHSQQVGELVVMNYQP